MRSLLGRHVVLRARKTLRICIPRLTIAGLVGAALHTWVAGSAALEPTLGAPDREKMGKGVTLSKEELLALKELLNSIEL